MSGRSMTERLRTLRGSLHLKPVATDEEKPMTGPAARRVSVLGQNPKPVPLGTLAAALREAGLRR